jgi:hypothetical protein
MAAYFTVTNWTKHVSAFPVVLAFQTRVGARPKVKGVLKADILM